MRERILAIGCGAMCLLSLFALVTAGLAGMTRDQALDWVVWLGSGMFGIGALVAFGLAVRRHADDEDLFEGNRGVAFALSIIVIVAALGFMLAASLQPDFWRGLMDGAGGR